MTGTTANQRMRGVIAPVITPFNADLSADPARFVGLCRALIALGIGLAPFGTTGEGTALSLAEKITLLDSLAAAGIPMDRVMAGSGACALPEVALLARHAASLGCGGVLMLPPFFLKGQSEEGLFRAFARAIEGAASDRLRVYLYHFPRHSGVPLSRALIGRLASEFPGVVVGVKDSSGDWLHTEGLIRDFPGLDIFTGSDALLLKTLRAGGAGCIASNVNVNGAAMVELARRWQDEDADHLQDAIAAFRQAVGDFPIIPAVKALVAMVTRDETWRIVRPPLVEQPPGDDGDLRRRLAQAGFTVD